MSLEYAPKGLVGLLTPQANTTAEIEFNALMPLGVSSLVARMTSRCSTLEARLLEYFDQLDLTLEQFANAPLAAVAVACTGSSYLIGPEREDALFDDLSARHGFPVIPAGRSVVQACQTLSAHRIALLSPYSESLTRESVKYWQARGLDVIEVVRIEPDASAFHPIYGIERAAASRALQTLQIREAQAVIALGTGLPSLRMVLDHAQGGGPPLFSCMVALAWNSLRLTGIGGAGVGDLTQLMAGTAWRERFEMRY